MQQGLCQIGGSDAERRAQAGSPLPSETASKSHHPIDKGYDISMEKSLFFFMFIIDLRFFGCNDCTGIGIYLDFE